MDECGRVSSILRTIEEGILLWNTDGYLMYANPATVEPDEIGRE